MTHPARDYLDEWTTWMRAQSWSPKTIRNRVELVQRVARDAGAEAEQLTYPQVVRFLAGLATSASTRRAYYVWLNAWFAWLQLEGVREDNPMATIPKPRAGRREPTALTAAHVEKLLEATSRKRTRAMIVLAAFQGLRASEVARVHGDHFDLVAGTMRVHGKGDVTASLPLHPRVAALVTDMPAGWWFPSPQDPTTHVHGGSVTDLLKIAMKRAGVPGTAHSLRRWFASELLRQGVDLRVIQQLMRHASLGTTEAYLQVDDTQRRAGLMLLPGLEPSDDEDLDEPEPLPADPLPVPRGVKRIGCIQECPGHMVEQEGVPTDVELVTFYGSDHNLPVMTLKQGDHIVTLTWDQVDRLQAAADAWTGYGRARTS